MRRLLGPLACVAVLAGCGGGSDGAPPAKTTTTTAAKAKLVIAGLQPPSACYLTVFLVEDATKAQIASVQRRLLRNKAVSEVAYVSKGLALERFVRTKPNVAKRIHVNPFSDQFEVVPHSRGVAFAVVADFATHGGPITNVLPSRGCAIHSPR
jgi:hypothetical protein